MLPECCWNTAGILPEYINPLLSLPGYCWKTAEYWWTEGVRY
jgi:hypothetical protein